MVVSLVSFVACGGEEEPTPTPTPTTPTPTTPPPPPEPAWEWPERINVMSGTGVGLAATTAWTSVMSAETGMSIRIVPEVSPMLRFKWLGQGRFFSVAEASTVVKDVIESPKGFNARDGGPFQLRVLWSYSKSDAGFIVRGDSDIKTVYDIKPGTKFVDLAFYPGYRDGFPAALLAWAGVDPEDIEWVPGGSFGACIRFITGGQADVCLAFPPSPDVMEAAASPHGIRWLDLPYDEDPEGAKKFIDIERTSALGVMFGSPEASGVRGVVGITPVITRADADLELVYNMAKWLDENYDLYKETHVWTQYMTRDNLMDIMATWFLPAHDGLVKYLKEKGLWTAAHDVRQAQNIAFVTSYVDAFQEAIEMADDQGIMVDAENEEWIELWENYKQQLGLPKSQMFVGLEE